jgi:rare lipoprotein A
MSGRRGFIYFLGMCFILVSCSSSHHEVKPEDYGPHYWIASYYADDFHGKPTASGEIFDMYGKTAAHKNLPFGTRLKVTNTQNGRTVIVTVNDRGPFVEGRDLDLSYGAAKEIELIRPGTAKIKAEVIDRDLRYIREARFLSYEGPFTIQVGSFRDKGNAFRLKDILAHDYSGVYIFRVTVEGKEFFRVCVGKFDSRDSAAAVAKRLADEGYGIIVISYQKQA